MNTRWVVVDQHGRKMIDHRTPWPSRIWLREVRRSNPKAVEGWTVERWAIARLGATIKASTDTHTTRSEWRLGEDGWWDCACCERFAAYRSLVEPLPLRRAA